MGVTISSELEAALLAAAAASPAAEICGLLFGARDAVRAMRTCANVADDPTRRFEIDPRALFAAHRAMREGGPVVIGHFHSHPTGSAKPSPRDADAAMGDDALWLIVGGGAVRAWRSVRAGAFMEERLAVMPSSDASLAPRPPRAH